MSFVSTLAALWEQPVISAVVKGINGRGVRRAGREYMNKNFSSTPSFRNIENTIISTTNLYIMTFFQEIIYLT